MRYPAAERRTLRLRRRTRLPLWLPCVLAFLLASLACVPALPAQVVRGTLLDDQTGQRIATGTVSLLNRDSVEVAETHTTQAGTFELQATHPGSYRLHAEGLGFVSVVSSPMELKEGDTISVQVALSKHVVVLNPIVVKPPRRLGGPVDDFYDRLERLPWGKYVTPEEIERSHAVRATDLLRRIPGVRLVPARRSGGSKVILRGTCSPTIIVDGSRTPIVGETTIDDLVKPSMLQGIEVYLSPVDVPAEYGANVGCGAILLWTR